MGAPLPPLRLIGSHACDRCGSTEGPHFLGHWGTLCLFCEVNRVRFGYQWRFFAVVAGLVALLALTSLFVAALF
jgi:hypothetical protein